MMVSESVRVAYPRMCQNDNDLSKWLPIIAVVWVEKTDTHLGWLFVSFRHVQNSLGPI